MARKTTEELIEEKKQWRWRDTMRPVRFFHLDARAGLMFLILLIYARLSTLIVTILVTMIFQQLEKRGLTFPAALRAMRVWLIGRNRSAWLPIRRRRLHDYG